MRYHWLIGAVCFSQVAFAAFEWTPRGGRVQALGGASIALSDDGFTAFSNPAGLGVTISRSLSMTFSPQRFGLTELASGAASFVVPFSFGTLALSGSRFGFQLYRETTIRASWGYTVAENVSAGLSFNYYSLSIERYGAAQTMGVDAGVFVQLSDELSLGTTASNINSPRIGEIREKLPQTFATGLSYRPVKEILLLLDIVKDVRHPAELRGGLEYTLLTLVTIRGGTSSDPSTLNAGVGFQYFMFRLDYSISDHPDLGMTHEFSLSFSP